MRAEDSGGTSMVDAHETIADVASGRGADEADDRFRNRAALLIAILAAVLAIGSLGGGNATDEMLFNNIRASDTWAFYQAKSIRQTTMRVAADGLEADLLANPNMPPEARKAVAEWAAAGADGDAVRGIDHRDARGDAADLVE